MDPSDDDAQDSTINPLPQDNDTPYSPPDDVDEPVSDPEDESLKPALETDQQGNERETDQQELYDQGQEDPETEDSSGGVDSYEPPAEEDPNPPA